MAVTLRGAGTATAAGALVTAINPAVPATAAAGDLSVLAVEVKPYSATITTPGGWTKIGENTNGVVASGTDTGSTKVALYVQVSAAAGAIGNITFGGAPDSAAAVINTYMAPGGTTWDYSSFTTGGDTTNAANFSATGAAGIAAAAGDRVIAAAGINGDVGTLTVITIAGMTAATILDPQLRQSAAITTGNQSRLIVADVAISGAASNVAPTLTYTNASAGSGSVMWLRLRITANAVAAALVDSFDVQDTTIWNGWASGGGAAIRIAAGTVEIDALTSYPSIESNTAFDVSGSALTVALTQLPNLNAGTTAATFEVAVSDNDRYNFGWTNAGLFLEPWSAGVKGTNSYGTYTAGYLYWRARGAAGALYMETSPDGVAWTTIFTIAVAAFPLTAVVLRLRCGCWDGAQTGTGSARFNQVGIQYVFGVTTPTPRYR